MAAQIPDFSKTALLLPFKGANGSQSFVDHGPFGRTINVTGSAAHSTALSKPGFGYGSSCYFDGTADYLATSITLPTIWSVRAWIYMISLSATRGIMMIGSIASNANRFQFQVLTDGRLNLYSEAALGTVVLDLSSAVSAIPINTWVHVEASSDGTTARLFVDGNIAATGTLSGAASLPPLIYVGASRQGGQERYFYGHMNDFELVTGSVLHTSNFDTPARLLGTAGTTSANPVTGPDNNPAVRTIVSFPRKYPARVRTTTSASDGSFSLELPSTEHTLVYLDDDAGDLYNDLCHRVIPE